MLDCEKYSYRAFANFVINDICTLVDAYNATQKPDINVCTKQTIAFPIDKGQARYIAKLNSQLSELQTYVFGLEKHTSELQEIVSTLRGNLSAVPPTE